MLMSETRSPPRSGWKPGYTRIQGYGVALSRYLGPRSEVGQVLENYQWDAMDKIIVTARDFSESAGCMVFLQMNGVQLCSRWRTEGQWKDFRGKSDNNRAVMASCRDVDVFGPHSHCTASFVPPLRTNFA
ncbi:hypothetical protein B0H17DRAFT_1148289 [Mycena rosella]|uniref:Uncharacterized protein n=1 Tax=Mycena rosella TaxID=1033263 RepID=A0AAD7CD70_MYCRO|nr:hypothetical protein B0H17DRAFT_1148289 [Mycena rosella]